MSASLTLYIYICSYVVLYALVHYEKAVYIECSAVYIVTEPNVN